MWWEEDESSLSQCFEHKQLSAFPTTKAAPRSKLRHITIPVYCPCLRPDSFDQMIQCDRCDVWHHYKCVNIKEAPRGDWFCPACSWTVTIMYYSFVFVSLATVHVHIANIVMKISLLFHSFYYSIVLYIHIANIIMKISLLLHMLLDISFMHEWATEMIAIGSSYLHCISTILYREGWGGPKYSAKIFVRDQLFQSSSAKNLVLLLVEPGPKYSVGDQFF